MVAIGDVVLIYREELPAFFAQIQDISPDRKRHWHQVTLLVLQIPLMEVVWTLRGEYINGEAFTMNGDMVRMEKVSGRRGLAWENLVSESDSPEKDASANDKVIPIFGRKRR